MPNYAFKCSYCKREKEVFLKIVDRNSEVSCSACGTLMDRLITPVAVMGDFKPYTCPITERLIEGRRQHEENLKRHGCRLKETGETTQFIKQKEKEEADFDKKIEREVEKQVALMPAKKREVLFNEIASGVETTVVRQ